MPKKNDVQFQGKKNLYQPMRAFFLPFPPFPPLGTTYGPPPLKLAELPGFDCVCGLNGAAGAGTIEGASSCVIRRCGGICCGAA
jgi:hypothetical protein